MLTLTTTYNTYLKFLPKQAASLGDNEKLFVQADRNFAIRTYVEEQGHFKIVLAKPIRNQAEWFVLISDTKITNSIKGESLVSSHLQLPSWMRFLGIVVSLRSVDEVVKVFGFLNDRLGGKPIELSMESKGKKLKIKKINVSNQQELEATIKAAQDFVDEETPSGKILFDTPDQMKVGIIERVSLRITKKLTNNFFEDLIHSQEVEVENIRVSQFMSSNLRGDDFKIEALGNEKQIIEDNDFTQWDWKVVPLKGGNRKLWATITIQVKVENEQALKTLPVLEKEVSVMINPAYSTGTFVVQYWQWLIASAIIPIVGLLLKK